MKVNIGFESKELISRLHRVSGVNNATLSDVLKRHLKYNLVSILQLLDKAMEGNTNLHNETEKFH